MMLNLTSATDNSLRTDSVEFFVRNALSSGVFFPAAETQVHYLLERGDLSDRDRSLLAILRDAIADGCIHRESASGLAGLRF